MVRLESQPRFGVPRDCHPDSSLLEVVYDFQVMFIMGFMLAILTGVHMPDRRSDPGAWKSSLERGSTTSSASSGPGREASPSWAS